MRTKIVYVLVSCEKDYYYEMLLLSHYSLRLYHSKKDVEVVVVMDRDTHQRLDKMKAMILDDIVPVVVDVPGEYTVKQRSRYLKTSLTRFIEGDFLYLDTDTIICEPLDAIETIEADIAMVPHRNGNVKLMDSYSIELCKRAGFDKLEGKPYYNAGVALVKNTPLCHRLFDLWHKSWKNQALMICSQDQPALCKANIELGFPIKELPGIWNCQLMYADSAYLVNRAKVFHYFSKKSLLNLIVFDYIKETGMIPAIIKSKLIDDPKILGYMFYMNDERAKKLVSSDLPFLYESNPPFFRLISPLVRLTKRPIRLLSKIKQRMSFSR